MPFNEVASECRILGSKLTSPSTAIIVVQYFVIGKILEDADGLKQLSFLKRTEKVTLHLSLIEGQWKISMKSLMELPWHATANAWADHFEKMIEPEEAKKSDIDRNLAKLVAQLRDSK